MAERFQTNSTTEDVPVVDEKHLNLPFFFSKLFTLSEVRDVTEVDQTLSQIKSALIYKGVDFGIIFAEATDESDKQPGKGKEKVARKVKTDDTLDLMCHYTRFAQ